MKLYLVEVLTGSCEQGSAMVFDSIWDSKEKAEIHCQKFKSNGSFDSGWEYSISEVLLNCP